MCIAHVHSLVLSGSIYLCMDICMHGLSVATFIRTVHLCLSRSYWVHCVELCVLTYVHTYVCMNACTYVRMYVCTLYIMCN